MNLSARTVTVSEIFIVIFVFAKHSQDMAVILTRKREEFLVLLCSGLDSLLSIKRHLTPYNEDIYGERER